jgi:hypothetical protein
MTEAYAKYQATAVETHPKNIQRWYACFSFPFVFCGSIDSWYSVYVIFIPFLSFES